MTVTLEPHFTSGGIVAYTGSPYASPDRGTILNLIQSNPVKPIDLNVSAEVDAFLEFASEDSERSLMDYD